MDSGGNAITICGRHDVFALQQVVLIIFCEGTQSPFVLKAVTLYLRYVAGVLPLTHREEIADDRRYL